MRGKIFSILTISILLLSGIASNAFCQDPFKIKIGAVASGSTSPPNLVISQQKLDRKYGLDIEWVKLNPASVQKAFALHQFEVNFAQTPLDLIRQSARGDRVFSFRSATFSNNFAIVRKDSPYQSMADLKGKKFGIFTWSSGSTAAFNKIIKQKYGLELKKDFEVIVGSPPALKGLLEKGEIEGAIHIDPVVMRLIASGKYRQLLSLYEGWKELTGSPLLVTTLAAWKDFAGTHPQIMRKLVQIYDEAVDYIASHPDVYKTSGFIKQSLMPETAENVNLFNERFTRLYTKASDWNQSLVDANNKVFDEAVAMKTLEKISKDWYTFEYSTR